MPSPYVIGLVRGEICPGNHGGEWLMRDPKLACCNFIPNVTELKEMAMRFGFDGVEWTFTQGTIPYSQTDRTNFARDMVQLAPLETRFHCAFEDLDVGHQDAERSHEAVNVFRHICRVVRDVGGQYLTIHLGTSSDEGTRETWRRALGQLGALVLFADELGVRVCLENLPFGWTSNPDLLDTLLEGSGAWATLDIGHAQVSSCIARGTRTMEDFVGVHPGRFMGAHIYDEEHDGNHHPPQGVMDIIGRLQILRRLPRCHWWVLELWDHDALVETLGMVRSFLAWERQETALSSCYSERMILSSS